MFSLDQILPFAIIIVSTVLGFVLGFAKKKAEEVEAD
jgi:hypothetical protein